MLVENLSGQILTITVNGRNINNTIIADINYLQKLITGTLRLNKTINYKHTFIRCHLTKSCLGIEYLFVGLCPDPGVCLGEQPYCRPPTLPDRPCQNLDL